MLPDLSVSKERDEVVVAAGAARVLQVGVRAAIHNLFRRRHPCWSRGRPESWHIPTPEAEDLSASANCCWCAGPPPV
eukprot:5418411-Prorocentrum_lima.AAC.1